MGAAPPGSATFDRALRAIDGIGEREIAATTQIAARFEDRPIRAVEDILAERASLSRHLGELRAAAARLVRRSDDDLADELADLNERIGEMTAGLDADRAALEVDNAALDQQERALWRQIETLRQYAFLAGRLDDLLEDRIATLGDAPVAATLRTEALYAIRRRRRDLLLQLAVATQGYAALRLVEQDNLEVIWAIRAATTTTVTALRTALLAMGAIGRRAAAGSELAAPGAGPTGVVREAIAGIQEALDDADRRRRTTLEAVRARPTGGSASG